MTRLIHSASQIVNPLQRRRMMGYGTGPGGASFVGALDGYTANLTIAWSVSRRLLTSYTGSLIRVRRSSDSSHQDIGYLADGSLDEAALLAFTGAGDGFIHTVYEQSAGRNFGNATAAAQSQIVSGGSIIRDGSEAANTVSSGTNSIATFTTYEQPDIYGSNSCIIMARMKQVAAFNPSRVLLNGPADVSIWATFADEIYWDYGGAGSGRLVAAQPTGWDDAWHWLRVGRVSGTQNIVVDGVELGTGSLSATVSAGASYIYAPYDLSGGMREFVVWNSGTNAAAKEAALTA